MLPTPIMLYGHDIAVGDVILDVFEDAIEAFLVDEVTVDPDPCALVLCRGRRRLAFPDGHVSHLSTDMGRAFGKRSRQPVTSTFQDCTGDWDL